MPEIELIWPAIPDANVEAKITPKLWELHLVVVQVVVEFDVELEDPVVVAKLEDVIPLANPLVNEAVEITEVVGIPPAPMLIVVVVVVVVVVTPTGRIG